MKQKKIIAFILSIVMFVSISPSVLFDIKASAADAIAEYTRYTASGTPAIADGIYIITHDGTNGNQASNTTTEIMDITSVPRTGRFGEVTNVTITSNKIQTSRAYELNFKRSGSTGNTYYITNNEGKYLTIGSSSLSFGTSQTALTVSVSNGNVYIYRNNYRINHSSQNYFSTNTSGTLLRLFKYEKDVSGADSDNSVATFDATIYKYGYTSASDYSSGGYDINAIAQQEMLAKIMATPEILEQIEAIANSAAGSWRTDAEKQTAIEKIAKEYAKIYSFSFTQYAVRNGTNVNNYSETFWNLWAKAGTKGANDTINEGASVQGLFSTTLDENGLPTSHDPYENLPYINTNQSTDSQTGASVGGLHANSTLSITKGNTSRTVTLTPLSNISVYVPDLFSRNDIISAEVLGSSAAKEKYAKYYWDLQFPFVESINEYGVNSYIYDSHGGRVFQAKYVDENHSAQAQLTEVSNNKGNVTSSNSVSVAGFFPFNNRLDGSNANMASTEGAIYHFGMSFTTEFFIPTSGHYGEDPGDIIFEFSGDDDVLVYIDNVLVLDNGGLHGARSADINFTKKSVTYQFVADVESNKILNPYNEGVTYTYGADNGNISAENQAAIEYLNKIATDGQQHTFTFYYLERGSNLSNCKISFNMQKISDHVKLVDQTYVVDYGIPVKYDITKNNVLTSSVGNDLPEYEYVGVTETLPADTNSLVLFREPDENELSYFKNGQHKYDGEYSNYVFYSDGTILFTPKTMSYTGSDSIYYCARITNDATYDSDTVYYMFEQITIVPATTIYYEDDFVGDAVTYTPGSVPVNQNNIENHGIWQTATISIPTGVVKDEIYQHIDEVGAVDANIYGFDQAYADCSTYSGYSSSYVTVSAKNNPNAGYSGGAGSSWPKAEFTFTGTGFDIISVTSKDTGTVQVVVKDSDGKQIKNHTVNTYYGYSYGQLYRDANGNTTLDVTDTPLYFTSEREYTEIPMYYADNGTIVAETTQSPAYAAGWIVDNGIKDNNSLYQIPIIKVEDLAYGSYTVTITPMYSSRMDMMKDGAYDFYLDAIRIYNPAGIGETLTDPTISYAYTTDKEANPDYLELRNMLIGSNKLTNDGTSATGAVFIDGITSNEDVSKYTSAGPNNELYLQKNQAVAFEIWASAIPDDVQIGAKAVGSSQPTMTISYTSGSTTYKANTQISTSTDLYYSINDLLRVNSSAGYLRWTPVTGSDGKAYYSTGTIVIQNTTDGIISITNLKWTFPSAGIGYYEKLENGGAQVASEPVTLMSNYSTFALARTALRMDYADLEITEKDVTVENSSVMTDESIVIKVKTSADVDALVIRDKDGNVITPEAVESYVETINDEDVKQWQVTLSENEAGTYTYTITGAYENGYESDAEPVVVTVTVEKPEEITEPEKPSFFEKLIGFVNILFDFFKNLIALLTY